VILDPQALEAAAKAVGSTDIATLAVTVYLTTLADKIGDDIEFRELGPLEFAEESQPQLPGVPWQDYEQH
jgi:hypothetical protein